MRKTRRNTAPRHYPLTDEDLAEIERGAPDTSASTILFIMVAILVLSVLALR